MNARGLARSVMDAAAAVITLLVVAWLLWASGKGFDVTDEGFYLLTARHPEDVVMMPTVFHHLTSLLLRATGGSIVALRIVGVLGTAAAGAALGSAALAVSGARRSWLAVSAVTMGALLAYTFLLLTPSYNTYNAWAVAGVTVCMLRAFGSMHAAMHAAASDRTQASDGTPGQTDWRMRWRGWRAWMFGCGIFLGLSFFVKFPTAAILGGLVTVAIAAWPGLTMRERAAAFGWIAMGAAAWAAVMFLAVVPPRDWWREAIAGLEQTTRLGAGHGTSAFVRYARELWGHLGEGTRPVIWLLWAFGFVSAAILAATGAAADAATTATMGAMGAANEPMRARLTSAGLTSGELTSGGPTSGELTGSGQTGSGLTRSRLTSSGLTRLAARVAIWLVLTAAAVRSTLETIAWLAPPMFPRSAMRDMFPFWIARFHLHWVLLMIAIAAGAWLGARLRGTDLRGSDQRGTDLRGADLRGADLRGADLRGAAPLPSPTVDRKRAIVGLLLAGGTVAAAFGTANPIYLNFMLALASWSALLILAARYASARLDWSGADAAALIVVTFAAIQIVGGTVTAAYGLNEGVLRQTVVTPIGSPHSQVSLDPDTHRLAVDLQKLAAACGLREGDDLLAFYNMPGLVYALGARSPGLSWYTTGLPGSRAVNELGLDAAGAARVSRAFILQTPDADPWLRTLAPRGIDFPARYAWCGTVTRRLRGLVFEMKMWRPVSR